MIIIIINSYMLSNTLLYKLMFTYVTMVYDENMKYDIILVCMYAINLLCMIICKCLYKKYK